MINLSENWSRNFGDSKQASTDVTTVAPSLSKRPSVKPQASEDGAAVCSADLRPQGQNGQETPRPLSFDLWFRGGGAMPVALETSRNNLAQRTLFTQAKPEVGNDLA